MRQTEKKIEKLESEIEKLKQKVAKLEGLLNVRQKDIDRAIQQSDARFYSKDPHSPF